MRILIITGSLPPMPCGVGDYTGGLAEALASQHGVKVVLLGGDGNRRCGASGPRLLPQVRGWGPGSGLALASALRHVSPDIVHFQFPTQGYGRHLVPWLLPAYAAVRGHRVVVTWHEYAIGGMIRYLSGALAATAFVVVRPGFREHMSSVIRWLVSKKDIEFIPGASVIPRCALSVGQIASIRSGFAAGIRRVVAYFGFTYPAKGTHRLFEILDPEHHHLVLIGRLDAADPYQGRILDLARGTRWQGRVTLAGFQPPEQVSGLLAACDAVLLPFPEGGGVWNSSLHAAVLQGTFVVTTARERQGYDPGLNVHYADPDDVVGMRSALDRYGGTRKDEVDGGGGWDATARAHVALYRRVLGKS